MIASDVSPRCTDCKFISSMTQRCMNKNSPYYKRPVGPELTCRFHQHGDPDRRAERAVDDIVANTPAFASRLDPASHLRSIQALEALTSRTNAQPGHNGCFSCGYNTRRDEGIGAPGCHYPGNMMDLEPLDDGLRCPEWTPAEGVQQ